MRSTLRRDDPEYGVVRSRRLLIDTLRVLEPFDEAITVIGAHAVNLWTIAKLGAEDMQSTRDADVSINPQFVTQDPKLVEMMGRIHTERANPDRPGIYGYADEADLPHKERTTIDLIVPEAYAGGGRRAATIAGQKNAATRARGLEMTVWDRSRLTLTAFDDLTDSIEAWVASPAALLVAKAHKVHERLGQYESRPYRLRPKDSGDIALLMMSTTPAEAAQAMISQSNTHPEIAEVIRDAATWLHDMYTDKSSLVRQHAADVIADFAPDTDVGSLMDRWLPEFAEAWN